MLTITTDVRMVSDDEDMDLPKPPKSAKLAERSGTRPKPVAKNSQLEAKVPNVADQRDLKTKKGSSTQKSKPIIRKFLFFFWVVVHELAMYGRIIRRRRHGRAKTVETSQARC
jgi:hypothetical protein